MINMKSPTRSSVDLGVFGSLGEIVASLPGVDDLAAGRRVSHIPGTAQIRNVVTSPDVGVTATSFSQSVPALTPLLRAVTVIDGVTGLPHPMRVTASTNAADIVPETTLKPESSLEYAQETTELDTIATWIPVTRQVLRHNTTLQADINTFLTNAILVRLEQLIVDVLAADSAIAAHPFNTDIATTIRTAVAAAQSAAREIGGNDVTAVLSPNDHARLDLAGLNLDQWPATIISTSAIPDGTAFVGRLKLGVRLYASSVNLTVGHINQQLIENTQTVRAEIDTCAHVAAPGTIVKAITAAA